MTNSAYNNYFYSKIVLDGLKARLEKGDVYLYAADGISNVTTPAPVANSYAYSLETQNNILVGKKLISTDIYKMVKRNPWTQNTVYQRYACNCTNLNNRNYYVLTSHRRVYKCIDNNGDRPSLIEPSTTDTMPTKLSDGYIWQYMYGLTEEQLQWLTTPDYIPVMNDSAVIDNVTPGTIDFITVSTPGSAYNATHSGYITGVVSNSIFQLESTASPIDGVYIGSSLYITSGPGFNSLSRITSYQSNSSGRYITVTPPINNLTISSTYEIAPTVTITGNGTDAKARARLIEGRVDSIEIINRGLNYTYATATVTANSSWGTGAELAVTISPITGHGSDPASELAARHLLINTNLENAELAIIPTDITFSRYGLITDVTTSTGDAYSNDTFNNCIELNISVISGTFNKGDIITSITNSSKRARIVHSSPLRLLIQYINDAEFNESEQIASLEGSRAVVTGVVQRTAFFRKAYTLSVTNTSTVKRGADLTETINIILEV